MKFGVITFPGSNCDQDMIYVLETIMGYETVNLWHKDSDLQGVDCVILPGGFSYGDYLRSGAIAKMSPIMGSVINFANNGGYVLGVCNGFQILTESGLLPGALRHNNSHKFICKNVFIKPISKSASITADLEHNRAYKIPIAHGEGNYYCAPDTLAAMKANDQVLFQYSTQDGEVNDDINPNGALENIAGVCNAAKNVFGMMPHPERAADIELKNQDGLELFKSMIAHMQMA
jgi:phosphoribosylformylglycinamidine synthase